MTVKPLIGALVGLAALIGAAAAQEWPAHPLRIVVPFPAGGSADVQSRVIADELSKALGQPVLIDNKPGAGGNIGAAEAARARRPAPMRAMSASTRSCLTIRPRISRRSPWSPSTRR
jgi:tripartite-type tricarboxylate transporter receptor subunit TctC